MIILDTTVLLLKVCHTSTEIPKAFEHRTEPELSARDLAVHYRTLTFESGLVSLSGCSDAWYDSP